MAQLPPADRKATVAKMTTHYNQGMQKSILEHTTAVMGDSSRRTHQLPHLSAKNRKLNLKLA